MTSARSVITDRAKQSASGSQRSDDDDVGLRRATNSLIDWSTDWLTAAAEWKLQASHEWPEAGPVDTWCVDCVNLAQKRRVAAIGADGCRRSIYTNQVACQYTS